MLNINSYAGGADLWGDDADERSTSNSAADDDATTTTATTTTATTMQRFRQPSVSDALLEVVGVTGAAVDLRRRVERDVVGRVQGRYTWALFRSRRRTPSASRSVARCKSSFSPRCRSARVGVDRWRRRLTVCGATVSNRRRAASARRVDVAHFARQSGADALVSASRSGQ